MGAAPRPGGGIESLSGSYVAFNPAVGGDTMYTPGTPQTFCFDAHSYTDDWEYVYNLWVKFPSDWMVTNVYVTGTPTCTGGGTWGTFAWSFQTSPYEVNISHPRYQATTDDCLAHYCFDVISGGGALDSQESWYWDGDGYNYAPHNPCSSDQYTPAGQNICDEYIYPPADIPGCRCIEPGLYLLPPTQQASGCNGVPQEHTLNLYNNTEATGTFTMTYSAPSANGALTGPPTVTADLGAQVGFTVTLTPDLCAVDGEVVVGQIDAAGNGYTNTATIVKTVDIEPGVCPLCGPQGWLQGDVLDGDIPLPGVAPAASSMPPHVPPCTAATVTINPGNIQAPVDPLTGFYGPVVLISGTYTVEATAPGYSVETAIVTIVDEQTTIQDLSLYRPVVDVTPIDPISVSAPPNIPVVVPITITNLGHLPLEWEIVEIPPAVQAQVAAGSYKQAPAATGVDPLILEQMALSADGKADLFVAFRDTADLSAAYNAAGKEAKVQTVRALLRAAADKAQARVRAWLEEQGIDYRVFAIDNTLLIRAGRATLDALAAFPEVSGLHGNHTYDLLPAGMSDKAGPDAAIPWDLTMMSIPQVWDQLGITGQGAIVANVDTGVDYDHEALFPNYLCGNGPHADCWYDPEGGTTTPYDNNGHGTITMSQMAADNDEAFDYAVGSAPDAGWIACLGCPGGSCPDMALNACADWLVMATPYTPDVVDNTWGTWGAVCDSWYSGKLQAYRAANIVPVFSAGSLGNACATSTSPANNSGTFAVGATDTYDLQAAFSGTGPGSCPGRAQFPDVVAPGVYTCAAVTGGGYDCSLSGTSWAASLAAGCLALVKSAAPALSVDELEDVVMATADDKPNTDCGSPQPDPNYRYGDGRVNCFAAVSAVTNADLPWVSEEPVSGTLPALGVQPVEITFECTPEQDGQILTGTLRVNHNDPCAGPIDIPIEMTCGAPTPPDVEVTPTALSQELCPDITATQQLTICNSGDLPLSWELVEAPCQIEALSPPSWVPVSVEGAGRGGNPPITAAAPARPPGKVEPAASPEWPLWDQPLSEVNQGAYVDQEFPDFLEYSSFLADDFYGDDYFWISAIFVPGDGWNGFSSLLNADSLTWQIYADNGGAPDGDPAGGGNPPVWTLTLPPTDPQVVIGAGTPGGYPSDTTLSLLLPITIPPGHWWLVFYPTLSFGSYGQFGRQPADTTNGYGAQFINPGGGFGYGTVWTAASEIGFPGSDLAFRLDGGCCLPPDILWLSENPLAGTVAPHTCQVVDVTFDPTEMQPGDYFGDLLVTSNDPDRPEVTVPVSLTVLVPTGGADFTWSPLAPLAGETASFSATVAAGSPPFTFDWDWGDGTTGSGQYASHTYGAAGDRLVVLTAGGACGQGQAQHTLTVAPRQIYYYLPVVLKNNAP